MTDNEMKIIKKQLPFRTQIPWSKWTEEQKRLDRELSCIDMINSILTYNWSGEDAEWIMQHEEKAYHNYLAGYVEMFGRKKVVELIQGQINSIKEIKRNVHTDSEGLSYNSIVWNE